MSSIQIDKDVPLPRPAGYPFSQMKAGDSVFFPCAHRKSALSSLRVKIRLSALNAGASVVTRTVTENGIAGVRAWRLI